MTVRCSKPSTVTPTSRHIPTPTDRSPAPSSTGEASRARRATNASPPPAPVPRQAEADAPRDRDWWATEPRSKQPPVTYLRPYAVVERLGVASTIRPASAPPTTMTSSKPSPSWSIASLTGVSSTIMSRPRVSPEIDPGSDKIACAIRSWYADQSLAPPAKSRCWL